MRSGPESVLVTGASGLCGQQVVEHLERHPERFTVWSTSRRPLERDGHFRHDLSEPIPDDLIPAELDSIVHCAACVDERDASYAVLDANLRVTFNVAEHARARSVKRIVNLSSIAVYGARPDAARVPETAELRPRSAYGLAKVLTESLLSCRDDELDVVHLRLGYVLAPVMPPSSFLSRIGARLAEGQPVEVVNPDTTRFTFIEGADVARACCAALSRPGGGTFNLLADYRPTVREVVETIARLHPRSASPLRYVERPEQQLAQSFDTTRARELLGVTHIGDPLAAIAAMRL